MNETNSGAERLQQTLEEHERAVKRSVESLGELQTELRRAAADLEDERAAETLAEIGRRLETHESSMETVVETLDEHKRVLRRADTADRTALADAMERARRRARQEPEPPNGRDYENS